MSDFEFRAVENGGPIKMWTRGVQVEEQALKQLDNVASLPFIFKHVAAMPDVHWGMGATVGSVIATKGAIIPAAVGVDIGCGMIAVRTNLVASDLPDNLHAVRLAIEAAVPHGRTDNGGENDRGAWHDLPARVSAVASNSLLSAGFSAIAERHPKLSRWAARFQRHMGTLGTGNHFIEICLDEDQSVWIMLHSGSRGVGNQIGQYFIERAKEHMRRYFINLPDQDLAYLPDGTQDFKDYVEAVEWAQEYALTNRHLMLAAVIEAVSASLGREITTTAEAVNCHHNYVSREHHFGQNVIVTRKGAVRAREGDLGIIPGSMGTGSFIVRGKGNAESFHSCSHGAGRAMSRGAAKKAISLEQHAEAMKGIEARLDADVIDESPAAYKPISAVMAAQESLVDIAHRLRQVVNVKG
jgi:tRNA-splicing ligase RtcB